MPKVPNVIAMAALFAAGAIAAPANAAVMGRDAAIVAINPQPLPPVDRDRDGDFYDLG